ncbi:Na+/H+ antiporter subunit E [Polycladidibacter hongkongensis]|uniref:Na+/H+ antiporter subunit E n=1 Tax=Polycladidibacter hongkongensis TaxID=1647556 RepID=UPI0008372A90|nr:Na+/H+ antiporter subunit E [Pseudovibrio hongkongensis]
MNRSLFLLNLLMAIAWGAVTGSFAALNLLFGFILGTLGLALIREQVAFRAYVSKSAKVFGLAVLFLKELVLSSWRVLRIVIRPRIEDLKPGIIAVPLDVDQDFEITLLANMVTLTPGTLSVDVADNKDTLFVHCIDVPDPQETIDDIKNGFERRIMEAFR